jgi:orotate phosphoribosyltransferase
VERLNQAGIALHPLATWASLLHDDSGLAAGDRAVVENFLKDPIAWSGRHGGRIAQAPRVTG